MKPSHPRKRMMTMTKSSTSEHEERKIFPSLGEFEDGLDYMAISRYCVEKVTPVVVKKKYDPDFQPLTVTRRQSSNLVCSLSPKRISKSSTSPRRGGPIETRPPVRSPLGHISPNRSPKLSPKRAFSRKRGTATFAIPPKKPTSFPNGTCSTEEADDKCLSMSTVAIVPDNRRALVSFGEIVCGSHYQAISNYCIEKVSSFDDSSKKVSTGNIERNVRHVAIERPHESSTLGSESGVAVQMPECVSMDERSLEGARRVDSRQNSDTVTDGDDLEGNSAQLAKSLEIQARMIDSLKSHNTDLSHIVSSLTKLMDEKDKVNRFRNIEYRLTLREFIV
ncbi:hypothetical protein ACHAW5_004644 [Stephanodiscus triporus]|uniref:Uncharacterized protein n=1 Tax=Stephanodiscus triporus TaxID=2934178 RepID=A0ABD3MGA9_9STRA